MKSFILIILIATSLHTQAQVKSGVYTVEDQKPDKEGNRTILSGETRFFHFYELKLITLAPKKKDLPSLSTVDNEQVVIVKEGELKVSYEKENKTLSRGGVAHILPGDLFAFENSGKSPVS